MGFEAVDRTTVGRGTFLELEAVTLRGPDGMTVRRDVVRHPGGVAVLALDDRKRVVMVRQYRVAFACNVLEIPAGKLDHPGETPHAAAVRELEEEIGYRPVRLESLGRMLPSPGYTDEVIHLYAAEGIVESPDRRPDGVEEQHAEVMRITVERALGMIESGEITDAKTQIALLRWNARRRRQ